jgi:hypothetical protein
MSVGWISKREVDRVCVVRPQAGRCVKIEGEGETWDEGETGFKDYMI